MTRDEVIALAREAGLNVVSFYDGDEVFEGSNTYFKQTNLIERFAALVAAHEREECAAFLERGVDIAGLAGNPVMQVYTVELLTGCAAAIRSRT